MTDFLPPGDDLLICPNCKTINHPNAEICISCGIRLTTYKEVSQQWQDRQNEKSLERLNQLKTDADQTLQAEEKKERRVFIRQYLVLIVITVALISIVWGAAILINYRHRIQMQQLDLQYTQGEGCLTQGDYLCARNAFAAVYQQDPKYQDIKNRLILAKTGLAQEYEQNGQTSQALQEMEAVLLLEPGDPNVLQKIFEIRCLLADQYSKSSRWQDAIDELDRALVIRPGNSSALNQMKDIYNRWYAETLAKGDFLQAWWIRQNQNARFPK